MDNQIDASREVCNERKAKTGSIQQAKITDTPQLYNYVGSCEGTDAWKKCKGMQQLRRHTPGYCWGVALLNGITQTLATPRMPALVLEQQVEQGAQ